MSESVPERGRPPDAPPALPLYRRCADGQAVLMPYRSSRCSCESADDLDSSGQPSRFVVSRRRPPLAGA